MISYSSIYNILHTLVLFTKLGLCFFERKIFLAINNLYCTKTFFNLSFNSSLKTLGGYQLFFLCHFHGSPLQI